MRRWILIMLLLIYPFQVALAMADSCCVTTAQGVSHHAAEAAQEPGSESASDDTGSGDPHCSACVFSHTITILQAFTVTPAAHEAVPAPVAICVTPASRPADRPERPKWPAARNA